MKAYITKYALTRGIYVVDGEICDNHPLFMAKIPGSVAVDYYSKGEWHTDWESAEREAELMRQKAIKSAECGLKRLRELKLVEPSS